jgi:1,4-dihydroxy-2-naphthoate octaprenyltransferase
LEKNKKMEESKKKNSEVLITGASDVKQNSLKAWVLASRPKTWAAAIAPVVVGSAIAFGLEQFKPVAALCCLLFAVMMQIAANLINDLVDFQKGSDGEDRLGPLRATAQGWITPDCMKKGIVAVVVLGCLIGSVLIYYGGWEMILVGLFCVIFAYFYTSGPFPLAYNGLGDVAVVLFFGIVATGFTAYVQVLDWNDIITRCGLATGLVVNSLLVLNNYRDREQDEKAGKRTIIVMRGEKFGRFLYLFMGIVALALVMEYFMIFSFRVLPSKFPEIFAPLGSLRAVACPLVFALLICFYLIPHIRTWGKMCQIREGKALNSLIGETSRNMLIFAFLLSFVLTFN